MANKHQSPSFARRSASRKRPPQSAAQTGRQPGEKAPPDSVATTEPIVPAGRAWDGFWLVLALCVAWPLSHAYFVHSVTVRLCEDDDNTRGIQPEKRLPVILHEIANDGYVWNRYAEELGQNGQYRLRHTTFDNAPLGRSVHWNSAFAWYLRVLGELRRSVTGEPLRHAIFQASIWANPILLAIALVTFAPLGAWRFGPLCGAVFAIGMVSVPTFYEGFMPAYPDHHGVISFELLGMMFGVAWAGAGWVKPSEDSGISDSKSLEQARHGMTFSAICAGCGLWWSALSTAMVLVTLGVSVLVTALCFCRRRPGDPLFEPRLWKWWAICGAGTSFAMWLLEYFPNHMTMRLEVNHPLYSLAFLGGGWLLATLGQWLTSLGANKGPDPFPWRACLGPVVACAALPAAIVIGGSAVYIPQHPFMVGLWKNIYELQSVFTLITRANLSIHAAFGWYPVFLVASFILVGAEGTPRATKTTLLFLTIPIILLIVLQCYQSRWGLLVGPIYIALAGIVLTQIWRLVPRTMLAWTTASLGFFVAAALFVVPSFLNNFANVWVQHRSQKVVMLPGQALHLLHRQMARAILDDANGEPVVLLSSPNSSCVLSSIGGFRTVGTLYWENVEGLEAAAAALNAQSDEEALERAKKLGITHVSLMTWENFIEPYFRILHPKPEEGISFENSFGKRALFDLVIPAWTRPLVFPHNQLTQGLKQRVILLRVALGQSDSELAFHLARFMNHVAGKPEAALPMLEKVLKESPDNSLAREEYAQSLAKLGQYDKAVDELILALKDADAARREGFVGGFIPGLKNAKQPKALAKLLRAMGGRKDASPALLLQSAWMLATSSDAGSLDGTFALELLDRLDASFSANGQVLLARAAAHAAKGNFEAAIAVIDESPLQKVASPDEKKLAALLRESFLQGKAFVSP